MADVQHAQAGLPAVLLQRQRQGARAVAGGRRAEADAAAVGGRPRRQREIPAHPLGVHADLLLRRQGGQDGQGLLVSGQRACMHAQRLPGAWPPAFSCKGIMAGGLRWELWRATGGVPLCSGAGKRWVQVALGISSRDTKGRKAKAASVRHELSGSSTVAAAPECQKCWGEETEHQEQNEEQKQGIFNGTRHVSNWLLVGCKAVSQNKDKNEYCPFFFPHCMHLKRSRQAGRRISFSLSHSKLLSAEAGLQKCTSSTSCVGGHRCAHARARCFCGRLAGTWQVEQSALLGVWHCKLVQV